MTRPALTERFFRSDRLRKRGARVHVDALLDASYVLPRNTQLVLVTTSRQH